MKEPDYDRLKAEFEADAFEKRIVDGKEVISFSHSRDVYWNDGSNKVTIMFANGNGYVKEGDRIIKKFNWKEYIEFLNKLHEKESKFDYKAFAEDRERRENLSETHEQALLELDKYRTPFVPCRFTES
jgi:hypothetical protein